MYEPRLYRSWYDDNDLVSFNVVVDETDLFICADKVLEKEAKRSVEIYRAEVEDFIKKHREFFITSCLRIESTRSPACHLLFS